VWALQSGNMRNVHESCFDWLQAQIAVCFGILITVKLSVKPASVKS